MKRLLHQSIRLALLGLLLMAARPAQAFYDSNLGRWLNRDPIEEEGGLNLYGYLFNDPVNQIDPFGQATPQAAFAAAIASGNVAELTALLEIAADIGLSAAQQAALRAAIASAARAAALAVAAGEACKMARHESGQRNYINDLAAEIARKTGDPICAVLRAMMAVAKADNSKAGKALQQAIKQAMKAANCTHHN
jgi:RHS repeat-associated protein